MATMGGMWAPVALRLLRVAVSNTSRVLRNKISSVSKPFQGELQYIPVRATPTGRQPIHPIALLRQQRRSSGWYNSTGTHQQFISTLRRFMSGGNGGPRIDRTQFPKSNTSRLVNQQSGRAPFASTLRPNLTGGALPRTAGGYSIGGGARYFSHTPSAPAQVINNVSQSMRAFCLSGQRARFDGLDARGEAKYRAISSLEEKAFRKISAVPHQAPGSFIDFQLSPTVTALSPLACAFPFPTGVAGMKPETVAAATLNADGLLDELSIDFARAWKDLSVVFTDLKKLAILGDLPITLEKPNVLRVRFPGVDAGTVEALCDDLGLRSGSVGEDAEFDVSLGVPIALKFPFAPDSEAEKTITSPGGSLRSVTSHEMEGAFMDMEMEMEDNPWMSDPESYESMPPPTVRVDGSSEGFEGLEGIYRFLEECDKAKGRF